MMIEKLIKTLKNDPNYKWESPHSSRDLFSIAWIRLIQVTRGLFLKLFLKKSKGLLFRGSHVKVRHAYKITAGKNLILEDNVSVNALSENGISFGDNVSIARDSILFCTGIIAYRGKGISIGDRTGISARAYFAGQGGITIGNDVIMGPNVQVFSENHLYNDMSLTIKEQGVTKQSVSIGNNCWVGAGSTILAGVTIGDGCVVAAGSVVTKSFAANSVIAGVPAKLIKTRGEN
ncbi:acyltransferase [Mucilaginibacter flavidus]|uniref:acyltransferase n=1 Tax=Mucilaginibacter flavidus TaxID=2949309 RepID=UPI002092C234|nr:acyltransferase [Mucilaginibacter flavidus]MCO5947257.1 acyltransferase [Mucilaginibacter flavidus]